MLLSMECLLPGEYCSNPLTLQNHLLQEMFSGPFLNLPGKLVLMTFSTLYAYAHLLSPQIHCSLLGALTLPPTQGLSWSRWSITMNCGTFFENKSFPTFLCSQPFYLIQLKKKKNAFRAPSMFLSGSQKLCSKDQYSFITIFEEFKQSCWGAEINRKFLFHMVNSMGELSTRHDRSSTTILAHERELWVCYSECQVYIGVAWRNTQKSKVWSFSMPLGRKVRYALCLGCGIKRDSLHVGLTTVSSGSFSQGVRVI